MRQGHVIGKIVFELHTSSSGEVNDLEEELRALIADVIKPKLEEYCNEIDERESVLHIDRLELDFGKIDVSSLEESIHSRIANCFVEQKKVKLSTITKIKEEQSDLEKIIYFLETGLLPWRSTYTSSDLLPSLWIQNLLQKNPQYIIDIIKGLLQHRQHLQRFILHTSDEVLMLLFKSVILPIHLWDFFRSMKEIWDGNASFESSRTSRLNFWTIVIYIFFRTDLKTKEFIVHSFLMQWASYQRISVSLLMNSLNQGMKSSGAQRVEDVEFLNILSQTNPNLYQAAHQHDLLQLAKEINKKGYAFNHERLAQIQIKLLSGIFNQMPLVTVEQRNNLIDALSNFLETLPDGILTKEMIDHLHFQKGITLSKVNFLDDVKQMQGLLQKIHPAIKNDIFESNSVTKAIHELINKNDQIDSVDQLILFLEKLQPVIQALPASMDTNELASYVVQLKVKLADQRNDSDDVQFLKMFYHLEKGFNRWVKKMDEEEITSAIRQLNKILKIIPQSVFHIDKLKHYQKVILMLEQTESKMIVDKYETELVEEINLLADFEDTDGLPFSSIKKNAEEQIENEIYIHNAGLVLIAPFIKSLFERIGYVKNNSFVDEDAIHCAIILLQYAVAPEQERTEYDLPLNKLLCGESVTTFIDVAQPIEEEAKLEAESMLSIILQQTNVFKNISHDGFRNAFLNREGALSFRDNHWLLKVSKETFDVVLDELPWQYHVVRLPWMTLPIVIEW